jgi:hypothetical protein
MKFFGPFKILARIGQSAYKLQLPDSSLVHPVFHVSQLKTHVPDHIPAFSTLPTPLQLDTGELIPEEILDQRSLAGRIYRLLQLLGKTMRFCIRGFQMHQLGNKLDLQGVMLSQSPPRRAAKQ